MIFYMASISYINPYFLAPSPLKPLKTSPRYQNLPGESLTARSDHKTGKIDQKNEKSIYVDRVSYMNLSWIL